MKAQMKADLTAAIEQVKALASERAHSTKTPLALTAILFDRLIQAVQYDRDDAGGLDRTSALKLLQTAMGNNRPANLESALKTSVDALTKKLNKIRDSSAPDLGASPHIGEACIRCRLDGRDHLLFVTGPRVDGHCLYSLSVRAEAISNSVAPTESSPPPLARPDIDLQASPSGTGSGVPPGPDGARIQLPLEFLDQLSTAAQNVSQAMTAFRENERHKSLIHRHLLTVACSLRVASLQLCQGRLYSDYDDCSLLTNGVAALGNGDELLGLTEWNTDWHWWETDDGRRFRDANALAVTRGAQIRRIFLCPEAKRPHRMAREMETQRKLGIEVRAESLRAICRYRPGTSRVHSQCVLKSTGDQGDQWGWLTYSVETGNDGRPLRNGYILQGREIKENCLLLEEIWKHARG
jgi:hypothetical protein